MARPTAETVFVVDDDRGLLRLVEKALQREGFLTAAAPSAAEARRWLEANRADLMLLDLKLQDMDGKELIQQLEAAGRAVPFIIITGQGDERVAVEMMKRGALDYLVKDVQFIEFVPRVVRHSLEKLKIDRKLAATQAALEESKQQLLMVSEREQRRFGAELHDGLGQQLTAIEMLCQSLRQDLPRNRPDLDGQISRISQYLREAISQTRALARGLSPLNLDSRGLADALEELAARTSRDGRIRCRLEADSPVILDDILAAGHLFRIAQEAVNNALKHSDATEIAIRLAHGPGEVRLDVSDNGKGLPEMLPSDHDGIGLQIMKHRASVIGAALQIQSQPGKGAVVSCSVPVKVHDFAPKTSA